MIQEVSKKVFFLSIKEKQKCPKSIQKVSQKWPKSTKKYPSNIRTVASVMIKQPNEQPNNEANIEPSRFSN